MQQKNENPKEFCTILLFIQYGMVLYLSRKEDWHQYQPEVGHQQRERKRMQKKKIDCVYYTISNSMVDTILPPLTNTHTQPSVNSCQSNNVDPVKSIVWYCAYLTWSTKNTSPDNSRYFIPKLPISSKQQHLSIINDMVAQTLLPRTKLLLPTHS